MLFRSHAGKVQVCGCLHVFEALDDENGHGVASHTNNEEQNTDHGDWDEGGGWKQRTFVVVFIHDVC